MRWFQGHFVVIWGYFEAISGSQIWFKRFLPVRFCRNHLGCRPVDWLQCRVCHWMAEQNLKGCYFDVVLCWNLFLGHGVVSLRFEFQHFVLQKLLLFLSADVSDPWFRPSYLRDTLKNICNQWENGNRSTQSEVSSVSNRPIRGQRYAKFNSRKFFYAYLRVERNRVPVLISSFGLVPTDLNSFYLLNTYPFQMTHNYVWAYILGLFSGQMIGRRMARRFVLNMWPSLGRLEFLRFFIGQFLFMMTSLISLRNKDVMIT